ncbi:hypothetical protein RclHR1_02210010 [Rhizophagus clarus]|uniref:HMG box domain-containing protein n=1 Tax=Rhizophagus clarus TaxID=94130 RepID=A0A2Z6QVS9_9GLOM|nr:hypothetical protein RclHR1_02210010 [Rhizophagus clarus]GET00188.1 hypothetical protein GLOIN_2v1765395 [Rhizophagus clarus]
MPKWSFIHENGRSPVSPMTLRKSMSKDWRSISVPFPPNVNPADFVQPRKDGKPRKRCANYFLIYRIQFAEALRASGYNTPLMTDISTMAGDAWREEPEFVRRYYKRVANEVKKLHDNLSRGATASQPLKVLENEVENSKGLFPLQVNITSNLVPSQQSYEFSMDQTYQNSNEIPQFITNAFEYDQSNLINENDYSVGGYNNVLFQSINELSLGLVTSDSTNFYDYFYR